MKKCFRASSLFIRNSSFDVLHSGVFVGAKGGTRTRTALGHWILSPARLPIPPLSRPGIGAPARTRTWNQWIKSPLLYQLSYGGKAMRNESRAHGISHGAACQAARANP